MVQYTNNAKAITNPSKTEVFISFSQITLDENNDKVYAPVADLVMTGELAQKLVIMLSDLVFTSQPQQTLPVDDGK